MANKNQCKDRCFKLLFNDRQVLNLKPATKEHTFGMEAGLSNKSGFYQVAVGNKVSEYYKVEIIKDLPLLFAFKHLFHIL